MAGDLPLVSPLGAVDVEDAVAEEVLGEVVQRAPLAVVGEVVLEDVLHVGGLDVVDVVAGRGEHAAVPAGELGWVLWYSTRRPKLSSWCRTVPATGGYFRLSPRARRRRAM